MANEYLMAILKNSVGEPSLPSIKEGDGLSSPPSFCPSSKNSSVGDMEELEHYTMGIRSPSGPMRGRTVKEFEEQLTNLKKENFNLKLRIYFLEEKMGTNFTLDKDNIVKKNIELQVEIANLQKEVKEKHELLCQAVKAIEIQEDEHRKYSQNKEEQMTQLQQEMEDLTSQIQDVKYMDKIDSPKSMSSRHSDADRSYPLEFIHELDDGTRRFAEDCHLEKHESQLANFVYDKAENLKHQIESLERECLCKDQTIDTLSRELTSANERLIDFAQQVKEYEEKLAAQHIKNGNLLAKMQEDQKAKEKLKAQLGAVNQKYSIAKFEFDQERDEFNREKKSLERTNLMLDMRVSTLDGENRKQRELIREQQAKLEEAIAEAKKNHNLAVSTCQPDKTSPSNTDDRFISATHAATPDRAAQEDPLHVQIKQEAGIRKPSPSPSSSKGQVPPTPDGKLLINFEKILKEGVDIDTIRKEFAMLKADFTVQKQKIVKLKSEQLKACEIIKNMIDFRNKANEEISQLKRAKEDLEHELENIVSKPQKEKVSVQLQTRLSEMNITALRTPPCEKPSMADVEAQQNGVDLEIAEQYKQLTVELEAKIEVLVETLKQKDSQMEYVRTQYDEILNTLEEKENKIVDLEFELLSNQHYGKVDRSLLEKGDIGSEKHSSFYKQELEEKNQEIERLNVELKKCTCYLQEIVNKELWEKNREIEKMHKKQETIPEVVKLRKELSGKDLQLKLLKEKICELGLDIKLPTDDSLDLRDLSSPKRNIQNIKVLQEQLKSVKEEKQFFEARVTELEASLDAVERFKLDKASIEGELERSERLRLETNEACSVLSTRLEELAIFLDSLLKQKSVLGFLGSAKNKRLREIISNSLDMSRSFNMSLMVNSEQSLAQLSNITALLNGSVFQELSLAEDPALDIEETRLSIVPDHISLTYENHLYKKTIGNQPDNEEVIAALREQVFNLKGELKVRDNELSRLQRGEEGDKESGVEQLMSESEADENETKLLTPKSSVTIKQQPSEAQSESEAWSEPDRTVSRARIGLNRSVPPPRLRHCESTEDDDLYHSLTPSKKRSALLELSQDVYRLQKELEQKSEEIVANNVMYRQKLQELDREMQESKEKLEQAELERNSAMKKVDNLQKIIEELTASKKHYEEVMVGKDKEMQDKMNRLEAEKHKIVIESQAYAQQVIDAKNQVIVAQDKVKTLEDSMEKMEKELRREYEENLIAKLKNAEEVFTQKVKAVEEKCEAEIRIAQESLRLFQDEYARDFIRKVEVESKLVEAETIMKQLKELKSVVDSYEQTISSFKEKENNIQQTIQHYQDKLTTMQSELDNATTCRLQAEQESSKITQEKQILEQEIGKVSQKERELRKQLNDIQNNLSQVTEKYSEQVTTLHKQKEELELKVSELESCNAALHNRLINAQTSRFSLGLNSTLPPSRPYYRRQYSDQNTYSSEDNTDDPRGFGFNRNPQVNVSMQPSVAEVDRAEANSSPDLGIESDHGRFSSLETNGNNVPRPLLQTIELTESMNNLFDGQNIDVDPNTSANEHCCQKSVEIAQENNELKRKLLRMKRALEETATQLNLANQRKKQVEKTICKQIHKTSQVLRKAKANLDSGSESDAFRM